MLSLYARHGSLNLKKLQGIEEVYRYMFLSKFELDHLK